MGCEKFPGIGGGGHANLVHPRRIVARLLLCSTNSCTHLLHCSLWYTRNLPAHSRLHSNSMLLKQPQPKHIASILLNWHEKKVEAVQKDGSQDHVMFSDEDTFSLCPGNWRETMVDNKHKLNPLKASRPELFPYPSLCPETELRYNITHGVYSRKVTLLEKTAHNCLDCYWFIKPPNK